MRVYGKPRHGNDAHGGGDGPPRHPPLRDGLVVHGGGTLTFDQIPQAIADLLGTDLATGQMIAGGAVVVAVVLMFMLAARSLKGGSETILGGAGIGVVLAAGLE